MSREYIQTIDAIRPELLKAKPEAGRAEGNGQAFRTLLAASVDGNGVKNDDVKQAAKAVEILQLEMMRSALSLEAALSPPQTMAAGGLNSLLAAYGLDGQQSAALPAGEAAPPAVETTDVSALPRVDDAPKGVSRAAGSVELEALISRASRRYGVDEGLIKAVIHVESNFKATAVSHAGAQGLMQLMPATAAGLGVTDSFNPEQNVMAGTRFLRDMLNRYEGNLDKALAAYNWGPGNVDRGKNGLPLETREYLVKVKKLYAAYSVA